MSKIKAPDSARAAGGAGKTDRQIHEFVARSLQAHYDSIIQAPVPDRFLVLLAKLEDRERKAAAKGESDER